MQPRLDQARASLDEAERRLAELQERRAAARDRRGAGRARGRREQPRDRDARVRARALAGGAQARERIRTSTRRARGATPRARRATRRGRGSSCCSRARAPSRSSRPQAAVARSRAALAELETTAARYVVRAPRAGLVEALPYKLGERPPAGAPVAVLLADGAPYARVYVPEPLRAAYRPGAKVTLRVDGVDDAARGHGPIRLRRSQLHALLLADAEGPHAAQLPRRDHAWTTRAPPTCRPASRCRSRWPARH